MAQPNIVNVSDIRGDTDFFSVGTSYASVISNSSGSNKAFKVNTVWVTNTTVNPIYVHMRVLRGGSGYTIASNVSVPSNSVLVLVAKDAGFYLEENDSLQLYASVAGLDGMVSYEVIS